MVSQKNKKVHEWIDYLLAGHIYVIVYRKINIKKAKYYIDLMQMVMSVLDYWYGNCLIVFPFINLIIIFQFRFLVDDVPIRRYPRKSDATFPLRPMWVYGSIWDASSWATEDGKYKADYKYQPFVARYTNFKATGCSAYSPAWCHPVSASPFRSGGLTRQQYRAMRWVQTHNLVYDYCRDSKRDHSLTPECWG